MNRKLAVIIGLQAFLIVMLFWILVFYGKDEFEALSQHAEEEIETPNRVSSEEGLAIITISPAAQTQSGIKATALQASSHQANISTYGSVIALDSLIDMRARYLAALADIQVLRTSLAQNKREHARLDVLNQDDKNVSDKAVAIAATNVRSDEARITAAESNAKNIADSMRQIWGETLAKHAMASTPNALLQNLIANKEVLVQTTLPFDAAEPRENSHIMIAPTAAPSHTIKARFVSRAPISNSTIQGKTYFYIAQSAELRAGMQVNALTATSSKSSNGVLIPNTAIVWYSGQPWVYLKNGEDKFSRLPINTDIEVENGWFYQGKLKPNDLVVTTGAQLLLSEEFKSQITNENED